MGVSSVRKNLSTVRMSNYVPDYSETSSIGKRKLLLPDEVLRFPLDQALVIIRGQKILRVRKMDYTRHSEAEKLIPEKTDCHIPEWRRREKAEMEQEAGRDSGFDLAYEYEPREWPGRDKKTEMVDAPEDTTKESDLEKQEEFPRRKPGTIEKVEDLFTDDW